MLITPAHAAGAEAATSNMLVAPLVFLAAAVVAVPLFKKLGLGSVLGYLAAGVVIGPSVLGLYADPEGVLHVAEFGVVLLLFIIGLELNLSRLWSMRRDIFGLGTVQIVATAAVCFLYPFFVVGEPWRASLVAAAGLALSSTAFVMQILEERGEMSAPHGKRAFAILLMQDLAIVPLLALVALLAPGAKMEGGAALWITAAEIVGAIGVVILAGRYLLNPLFRVIARTGARDIMTAAALLVVVGSAYLMVLAGLSMAMGAFLAGVLLAESNYRHELEADIEPFRGLLLGLFFIAVGMSVDLSVIAENWMGLLAGLTTFIVLKFGVVYAAARAFGSEHPAAVRTAAVLAQGGEFGFVLFSAAVAVGVMTQDHATLLIALVTLSMALTPAVIALAPRLLIRQTAGDEREESFEGAGGTALIIGFGRFGQITSQMLQARAVPITALDNDPERIDDAGVFGFKVYYGDGTRLDVLRAAGAHKASLICVCLRDPERSMKVVEVLREAYPDTPLYARAYDRRHAIRLAEAEVDYQIRDTYESALRFGRETLHGLGLSLDEAIETEEVVRRADEERLRVQTSEGIYAGRDIFVRPEPLTTPKAESEIHRLATEGAADETEPAKAAE